MKTKKTKPKIWTNRVSQAWALPEQLTVTEFAEREIILDESSAMPGRWRTEWTPYLQGIMDAFNDPLVEDIVMKMPTQVGKTAVMLNMMAYAVDQDPGPMMWVDSTEQEAREICDERIIPLCKNSPALRKHLPRNSDDITKGGIKFDRMNLKIGWSTSPSTLASRAIRYLFLNEINKYPQFSGREADPVKLAKERQRTFWNRKCVMNSSPSLPTGYITREYALTDQRKYYVPCPHCGFYQLLVWAQVKIPPEERDPFLVRKNRLAHYECVNCSGIIVDTMKHKMLLEGRWVPDGVDPQDPESAKTMFTTRAGFWLNCIYSPWLSFSDIAAEWLTSYQVPELHMNFVNSWLAEEWQENLGKRTPEQIAKLVRPYDSMLVPAEAEAVTGFVDVQKDHFYLAIRAWGFHGKSWLVYATRVEDWEAVIRTMFQVKYPSENPNAEPWQVRLTCIDANYRTNEVYEVCRHWVGLARPTIGKDRLNGVPFIRSTIERFPDGRPISGGLSLWKFDTTFFKDKLARLMQNTELDSPSGWFIHRDPSDSYVQQMCSEHKIIVRDRKTRRAREEWQPVTSHAQNHFWDCEVGNVLAAEMLNVFQWQPEAGPRINTKQQQREKQFDGENWVPRRKGWLKRD